MATWLSIKQKWKRNLRRLKNSPKAVRVRHINLFLAMILSLVGGVVIALTAAWLLTPQLNVGKQPTSPADLTRLALTVAAGVGGVVALVVAYRRQRDLEQGRFVQDFGAAAKQLGDPDVAVRLAGVYAMAGVADQTSNLRTQQCIDVLCAYLRLPYSPELGNNHQTALTLKRPVPQTPGSDEELTFRYRQNDKEVRQTIVRVIVAHLREKSARSWSANDFDFSGAHLEDADFQATTFAGNSTKFDGATFSGENTSFYRTTFSGETTRFDEATFSGETTSFGGATFSGKNTWFGKATFSGKNSSFGKATFSGENTSFGGATFSGKNTSFDRATFSGENTWFAGATFSGENTWFAGATFSGENTWFAGATFSGDRTSFEGATFSGAATSFAYASFGSGRVSFAGPQAWDPAPMFDWDPSIDGKTKPVSVEPQNWPPVPDGFER